MNDFDKFGLLIDLAGEDIKCGLTYQHTDNNVAVNYLVIPVKDNKEDLVIPLCRDCVEGMLDEDWVLFYCVACHASQWLYKPLARKQYDCNLIIFNGCVKCCDSPNEIYVR